MLYTIIDQKPNLINGNRLLSPKISGLGLNFISNAQLRWDSNSMRLIGEALSEIENLGNLVEAVCVDAERLCFSCLNADGEWLTVRLHPATINDYLSTITIYKNYINKIYEVSYASSINKLYLRLKNVFVEDDEAYNYTRIFRRLSNNEIFINLERGIYRLEIKIKRPKTDFGENFIAVDEENFLKALAALDNLFNPEGIWEIFKSYFPNKTSDIYLQMEFFNLLSNKGNISSRKVFIGGINIVNGKKRQYLNMNEKYAHENAAIEERILLLEKNDVV